MAHAVGCRFEWCQGLLFFYLYSIHTNKKFSPPSSQSSWMRSCHTMVLPKRTSLCTSITVITLWGGMITLFCCLLNKWRFHMILQINFTVPDHENQLLYTPTALFKRSCLQTEIEFYNFSSRVWRPTRKSTSTFPHVKAVCILEPQNFSLFKSSRKSPVLKT